MTISISYNLTQSSTIGSGVQGRKLSPANLSITQAAIGRVDGTQEVTESWAAVPLTGITTPGICFIQNLDATNRVYFSDSTASTGLLYISAGRWGQFEVGTTSFFLRSSTGTVKTERVIFEA